MAAGVLEGNEARPICPAAGRGARYRSYRNVVSYGAAVIDYRVFVMVSCIVLYWEQAVRCDVTQGVVITAVEG